jgi:chemotaxis protein CheY-P-specific phosphatase CheC
MADTRKAAESTTANAFETTLSSQLGASDLTVNVASTTGLASPCYIVVEPDSATQREYIFIDSTVAATSFTTTTADNRYLSGSAAGSGLTHPSGSKVRVAPMKQHFEDIFDALGKVVDTAYSSGTAGEVIFNVADATASLANDEVFIRDADDSNKVKRESISDIMTAAAGSGLAASSGVLSVDLNEATAGVVNQAADSILFIDADDNATKKDTVADFVEAINGSGIDASSGTLVNAAIGKQSIWIPATAMYPTSSNGCADIASVETTAGRPDLKVLDFDASSDENAQFSIAMPSYWNEGTITFQAYWTTAATDTDGVAWGLSGVACSDNDTIDVAFGTAVVVTDDALGAAEDLCVTAESGAVTIAGTPAAGDLAYFNIVRDVSDANDDMTEDARLIGIKIFYTVDDVHEA